MAVGVAVGVLGAAGSVAAAPAPPRSAAPVTAIVSLAGASPVRAPGVRVQAHLGGVGVELVRGTPAALSALPRSPGVLGMRYDAPVQTADAGLVSGTRSVFGWRGLGGSAGQPGAGAGISVALVDTGVSDTPALDRASGRLVDGVDTSPLLNGGEARLSGPFPDGFGHGTFLATLLAGSRMPEMVNALGVAPAARIVNVKVADDGGHTSLAAVLAGLDWVAHRAPVHLVALALAASRPTAGYGPDPLTLAISRLRSVGLAVVVAAGNNAGEIGDPGFAPQAITVGAADTTQGTADVAPFSGSGAVHGVTKPDLVAPGTNVLGLLPEGSVLARLHGGAHTGVLWRGSGTSEATAVAAGAAAIYLSEHPDTGPVALKVALRGAAAPMPDPGAGEGLLRADGSAAGGDSGEAGLDSSGYWSEQWAQGWVPEFDSAWNDDAYTGSRWDVPWDAPAWSAKSWSAKSWSAKSWSAKSWSAKSWSAKSWSAKSWSGESWTLADRVGTAP